MLAARAGGDARRCVLEDKAFLGGDAELPRRFQKRVRCGFAMLTIFRGDNGLKLPQDSQRMERLGDDFPFPARGDRQRLQPVKLVDQFHHRLNRQSFAESSR